MFVLVESDGQFVRINTETGRTSWLVESQIEKDGEDVTEMIWVPVKEDA